MRTFIQAALALIVATVAVPTAVAAQSLPTPEPASRANIERPSEHAPPDLLSSIITWLSVNFDLEPTTLLPKVKHASATAMAQRRYRTLLGVESHTASPPDGEPTTVAIYDRSEATIYLPLHWTGTTPMELSVLVHEMVHHLQNVAQTKFECPQARERVAYAAQNRWLGLFGRTLEDEFHIDPFTLLVTTRCLY